MRQVFLVVLAFFAFAPAAHAGGPSLQIGAAEDAVRQATLPATKAKLDQLRLVGLTSIRIVEVWTRGQTAPEADEIKVLSNVAGAAKIEGMEFYVAVYPTGSSQTPLSAQDRSDFATFAASILRSVPLISDIIVGNEPNLNRFWLPQFNSDGTDAAAPAYEALLAQTYDALKAVLPTVNVIGGAVSPRGGDKPGTGRDTHSPTVFITDLGAAYKASGRTTPIMDQFAIHPYDDNSSVSPTVAHPNTATISIADYDKLVALLGHAFDGTAQPGSTLPIVYGEFGVETKIPASKASLYSGTEPATTKATDEKTQGDYYREAIGLAFCQPNVRAILLLHAFDEPGLAQWQSGVYYVDGTPKTSLAAVAQASRDSHGGVIARCSGLQLTPQGSAIYPRGSALSIAPLKISVTCDIDCNVYARLEKFPTRHTTLAISGRVAAGVKTTVTLPARRVKPGRYRFTVRLTAPVNVGPPLLLRSGVDTIH